jgi:hypothetical protein
MGENFMISASNALAPVKGWAKTDSFLFTGSQSFLASFFVLTDEKPVFNN